MKTVETIPKLYSKEIILDTADNSILIINGTSITAETGSFSELNISGSIMTSTVSGSTALFTVISGSTVTGSTARFTIISGSTVTGSTARFTIISGSIVTGSTALFTVLTGSTVTGSTARFTIISGSTVTGSTALFTVLTGSAILISGDITTSGGNIVIGTSGKGIDFSATTDSISSSSELLADYEEGTWTPTISGSTTAGSFTYDRSGFYSKIGNLVYVNGYINVSTVVQAPTGNLRITGLPYNSPSFRSSGINFIDLRGTTTATILSGAQGDLAGTEIVIWKASSAATLLTATDLSPSTGLSINWLFNGFYRA